MREKFKEYAARQKRFWNVEDVRTAMFERIDTEQDKTEAAWDQLAEQDTLHVIRDISFERSSTLLEIGCGIGRVISKLKTRIPFRRFIGVDISEQMIQFAKGYLGEDKRIELLVNNGYDLSEVNDDEVDFGYSIDVFIHIYDLDIASNYLSEAYRVLKRGGKFRFNVRRWDVERAFGDSLGGKMAKWSYKLGLRSMGEHTWNANEEAELNGNQYTSHDLKKLISNTHFQILNMEISDSRIWCTLEK